MNIPYKAYAKRELLRFVVIKDLCLTPELLQAINPRMDGRAKLLNHFKHK